MADRNGSPLGPSGAAVDGSGRRSSLSIARSASGLSTFVACGISLLTALSQLHRCGLIHKNIKPASILVDSDTGRCWLTGFGIASRLPRERQAAGPPEVIAGSLAYMAPSRLDA